MQVNLQTVNLVSVILKTCYLFSKVLAPNGRTLPELPSLNRSMRMSAFFFLHIRDLSLQIWVRETRLFWSSLNHSQRLGLDQSIWIWTLPVWGGGGGICVCMYLYLYIAEVQMCDLISSSSCIVWLYLQSTSHLNDELRIYLDIKINSKPQWFFLHLLKICESHSGWYLYRI